MRTAAAVVLCVFLIGTQAAVGLTFGKNKVITKDYHWQLLQTEHFDLYYYDESEPLVKKAEKYLERAYVRVTSRLDTQAERAPFFLYADHNEFEETNIVDVGEGTGGVTEAFKNRFLIFNDGSQEWLDHVITHEFTHVVEFNVLNEGFWKSARLLRLIFYPLWMMEGLAEYTTGDVDKTERDMVLRDAAISDRFFPLPHLHNFSHLKPNQVTQAYKQGEAALKFLAEEYGPEKVPALLKAFRIKFDSTAALQDLIGLDLFEFDKKYRAYWKDYYSEQARGRQEPTVYGDRLTFSPDKIPRFNTSPALSPDGKTLAYLSSWTGTPQVFLMDIATRKSWAVAGRQFSKIEYISSRGRALSFSPDGRTLVFVGEKGQREYLYFYDISRRKLRRHKIKDLKAMSSPAFSPDGNTVALVGLQNGFSDLYAYRWKEKTLERLTQDERDDASPAFSPDGRWLVYSGEANVEKDGKTVHQRNLYCLDWSDRTIVPLTDMPESAEQPAFSPDGSHVLFTADPDHVRDFYSLDLTSGEILRLTKVLGGNLHAQYSSDGKTILFSSFREGEVNVYSGDRDRFLSEPTPYQSRVKAAPLAQTGPEKADRVSGLGPTRDYRFQASTDLFFPILFYSSTDGLFVSLYWQASELLGNHQLQAYGTYGSADNLLNYRLNYTYRRFRPQLLFGVGGNHFREDLDDTVKRREHFQWTGVEYPFDRFHRMELILLTADRRAQFTQENNRRERERENSYAVSLIRDTSTGQYLVTTRGSRLQLTHEESLRELGGDVRFRNVLGEYHQFVPVWSSSVLAFRFLGLGSEGPDRESFRLGGVDRVRGLSQQRLNHGGSKVAVANTEYRFPIARDLNYYMWYMFPDFFFKSVYGALFTDVGYAWDRERELDRAGWGDLENSVGLGIRIHVFILQLVPLELSFDWAKRTTSTTHVFYFSLGPKF